MAKLSRRYFSELPKDVQGKVKEEFSEHFNPAYLTGEYSDDNAEVGAEVVLDEDDNLYDIRVFDPYNRVQPRKDGDGLMRDQAVYIGPDGWSHWLFGYSDNEFNDIDTIFEEYNGVTQD